MFIEEVTLEAFRSFGTKTRITLTQGINIIVGDNGSGKSSILMAIQMILGPIVKLNPNERRRLIHHNKSEATIELVFNNKHRTIVDAPDIFSFRRVFSSSHDHFYLDQKLIKTDELKTKLLAMGFPPWSSFFCIEQNQVGSMVKMSKRERYNYIETALCFKNFDAFKCKTSIELANVEDILKKIKQTEEEYLEKLITIQIEADKSKNITKLKETLSMCKYINLEKLRDKLRNEMEHLEKVHGDQNKQFQLISAKCLSIKEAIDAVISKLELVEMNETELNNKMLDAATLENDLSKFEVEVNFLTDAVKEITAKQVKLNGHLNRLKDELDSDEREKADKKGRRDELKEELASKTQKLNIAIGQKRQLLINLNRTESLENEERKLIMTSDIDEMEQDVNALDTELKKVEDRIRDVKVTIEILKTELEAANAEIGELQELSPLSQNKNKMELNMLLDKKKELQSQEFALLNDIRLKKSNLMKVERCLFGSSYDAYCRAQQLIGNLKVSGVNVDDYCHMAIDKISCNKQFHTAVSIIAGSNLFRHIVRTDEFATKLLLEYNKRKYKGGFNFIAINRAKPFNPDMKLLANDESYIPLINLIEFEEYLLPVMQLIFGKAVLCRTLPKYADFKKSGVDFITFEGDVLRARGALSGGYYDIKTNPLAQQAERNLISNDILSCQIELQSVKNMLEEIEKDEAEKTKRTYEASRKAERRRYNYDDAHDKARSKLKELEHATQSIECYESNLAKLKAKKDVLKKKIEVVVNLKNGTYGDLDELRQKFLEQEIDLNKECVALSRELLKAEEDLVEITLRVSFKNKRVVDIKQELFEGHPELNDVKCKLKVNDMKIKKLRSDILKVNDKIQDQTIVIRNLDKAKLTSDKMKFIAELDELEEKKAVMTTRNADIELQIVANNEKLKMVMDDLQNFEKDFQTIDPDLSELPTGELTTKINGLTKDLKIAEANFNRKTLLEYLKMKEMFEEWQIKNNELGADIKTLTDLKDFAFRMKEEAVKYFDEINAIFGTTFQKLLPSYRAQLIINRNDEPADRKISIKVMKGNVAVLSNSLSSGQKTTLGLSLVLSLQANFNCPIGLFDEIDSYLDKQVSRNLGDLLKTFIGDNKAAQYIITTFNKETVVTGNSFLKVAMDRRFPVTKVTPITKDEAFEFCRKYD